MAKLVEYVNGHYRVENSNGSYRFTINDKHNRIDREEVEVLDWRDGFGTVLADFDDLAQAIVFVEGLIGEPREH